MGIILKLTRGPTVKNNSYTGLDGEVTVDSGKNALVVHDGGTPGGSPLATEAQMNAAVAQLADITPRVEEIEGLVDDLANTGVDTTARADIAEVTSQLAEIAPYVAEENDNGDANLFDSTDVTANKSLDPTTGALITSATNNASGPISVTVGATLTLALVSRVTYYEANNALISTATLNHLRSVQTVPANTAYMRVVVNDVFLATAQINTGATMVNIEAPYLSIGDYRLPNSELSQINTIDKFVVNGPLDGIYDMPSVAAQLDMATWQASAIYTLYDALVTAHPNYISKVSMGNDASGNAIYRYNFVPAQITGAPGKVPKVILTAGVHGDEKLGVYSLYQTMKAICDGWASNAYLDTLRWNFIFYVVPVVSVSAYNLNTRYNAQSVNVNRNFYTGWDAGEDHPGSGPQSTKEAQFVDKLILENRDAVLFCSYHHFDSNAVPSVLVNPYCGSQLTVHIAQSLIQRLSRKWKAAHAFLPQDDTTMFGQTVTVMPGGSEVMHAKYHNIPAINLEVCKQCAYEPDYAPFDSVALTLGSDAVINGLILALNALIPYFNSRI